VFAYRLKFCAECGSRIREYIGTSTKSADKSTNDKGENME